MFFLEIPEVRVVLLKKTIRLLREERYKRVTARREEGESLCYWCENHIPPRRLRHNKQQKYCCRAHFAQDIAEKRNLDGYYFSFSILGNTRQDEIKQKTGIRPGEEKRKEHIMQVNKRKTSW